MESESTLLLEGLTVREREDIEFLAREIIQERIRNHIHELMPTILVAKLTMIAGILSIILEYRFHAADILNGYIIGGSFVLLGIVLSEKTRRSLKVYIANLRGEQYRKTLMLEILTRRKP